MTPQARQAYLEAMSVYGLTRKFGLTADDYWKMFREQGGRCAICQSADPGTYRNGKQARRFCVDHDHTTGQVRGLLCGQCNAALGFLQDDPERLEAAVRYLRRFSFTRKNLVSMPRPLATGENWPWALEHVVFDVSLVCAKPKVPAGKF